MLLFFSKPQSSTSLNHDLRPCEWSKKCTSDGRKCDFLLTAMVGNNNQMKKNENGSIKG